MPDRARAPTAPQAIAAFRSGWSPGSGRAGTAGTSARGATARRTMPGRSNPASGSGRAPGQRSAAGIDRDLRQHRRPAPLRHRRRSGGRCATVAVAHEPGGIDPEIAVRQPPDFGLGRSRTAARRRVGPAPGSVGAPARFCGFRPDVRSSPGVARPRRFRCNTGFDGAFRTNPVHPSAGMPTARRGWCVARVFFLPLLPPVWSHRIGSRCGARRRTSCRPRRADVHGSLMPRHSAVMFRIVASGSSVVNACPIAAS